MLLYVIRFLLNIFVCYIGSVFLVPAFGGYIADVYTGKYKTILGSGFIYILGKLY